MSSRYQSITIVFIAVAIIGSACKGKRALSTADYPTLNTEDLISLADSSHLSFESFSAKVSADVKTPDQSNSFRATLRIRRDSAIWASISPALGIEVFRLLCTQDSVLYIDKMKKQYFRGTYKKLNEIAKSELTLGGLQDLLLGDPLYFNPDLKYRSNIDGVGYQLSTKNANRLRRMVGADRGEIMVLDSDSVDNRTEKKLFRLQERMDDDNLVVRQYWMSNPQGKVVQSVFTDLVSAIYLMARYSGHEMIDGQWIPTKTFLELGNTEEQATFKLDYSRIKLNESVAMPFSIPDKYEEVRNK